MRGLRKLSRQVGHDATSRSIAMMANGDSTRRWKCLETEYYAPWDLPGGKPEPFGLLRAEGPVVSRWPPGAQTWVEAPTEWDYLMGNQPGARRIITEQADMLKASGALAELSDAAIVTISTFQPHIRRSG